MGQEVRVEFNPVQHCQVLPSEDLRTFLVNIHMYVLPVNVIKTPKYGCVKNHVVIAYLEDTRGLPLLLVDDTKVRPSPRKSRSEVVKEQVDRFHLGSNMQIHIGESSLP